MQFHIADIFQQPPASLQLSQCFIKATSSASPQSDFQTVPSFSLSPETLKSLGQFFPLQESCSLIVRAFYAELLRFLCNIALSLFCLFLSEGIFKG